MSNEQVERVARALAARVLRQDPDSTYVQWREWQEAAEIAIAAMKPTPQVVEHGPVMTWRNDGGPWHESNKCKCGARHPHPTPDVDVLAEVRVAQAAECPGPHGDHQFRLRVNAILDPEPTQ